MVRHGRRSGAILLSFLGMLACSLGRRPGRVITQNSPSMRRIMSEWKMVQAQGLAMGEGANSVRGNSTETFRLKPVGNMFEWHFTFLGAKDSPFEGGLYHGSISLPADYPQSGPSVRILNHNQRFKVGSRICLSASEYHQETWQPSWTVTSLVTALVAHMTEPAVEIGSVQGATPTQKRTAAAHSRGFECAACGCCHCSFPQEIFPYPKSFVERKRRVSSVDGAGGRGEGGGSHVGGGRVEEGRGVGGRGGAVTAGGGELGGRNRGRLPWTVRVVASKPFLLVLVLLIARFLLGKPQR